MGRSRKAAINPWVNQLPSPDMLAFEGRGQADRWCSCRSLRWRVRQSSLVPVITMTFYFPEEFLVLQVVNRKA
jgi:uncharacterized protein (DUF2237 family)